MHPDTDDTALMCRAREGDVEAFAELFARHRERVERFLYRLFRSREKAEDGVQEVFIKLWMARQRYEPRARFTTFLYQVAHHYWIDEVRKAGARPVEAELLDEEGAGVRLKAIQAPSLTEPQHHLFVSYRQRQIREAIARLPDIYRVVFALAHLEGRKLSEIAEILGVPEGTVKSRMHTAVRLLRGWLRSDEGEE